MKKLLLILILNITLLFSPAPRAGETDPNGRYVSLNRFAGFFLNPDTYGFLFAAIEPRQLLTYQAQRQSRPLFILVGTATGYSITFLSWPVHRQLTGFYRRFWRGTYPEETILLLGNFYLGYLLLNILVLWMALFLFERVFFWSKTANAGQYAKYPLMIFIASNPVTKAFFWAVHQQMFSFLTPLLCIYVLDRSRRYPVVFSYRKMMFFFTIAGTLLLAYGNFILLLPVLLFAYFAQAKRSANRKPWVFPLLNALGLALIFFVPTLSWIGLLKSIGVPYYSFEISVYHQLVWIPETLGQSVGLFIQRLGKYTVEYILTMQQLGILLFFTMIILVFAGWKISWKDPRMREILFIFLCFFLFYWLLGFYEERLTNSLIPIVVCFWVASLKQKATDKKMIFILGSLALTWHFYVLFSYGPFC